MKLALELVEPPVHGQVDGIPGLLHLLGCLDPVFLNLRNQLEQF